MTVHLHIERLVLDESLLRGERAAAVGQAIEQELAQRLARMDGWHRIGAVPSLPPVVLPAPRQAREPLGTRVADAVGRSLHESIGAGRKP